MIVWKLGDAVFFLVDSCFFWDVLVFVQWTVRLVGLGFLLGGRGFDVVFCVVLFLFCIGVF